MKVAEATGRGTKALYYDISTDSGTLLGSACVNFYPLGDDDGKHEATGGLTVEYEGEKINLPMDIDKMNAIAEMLKEK